MNDATLPFLVRPMTLDDIEQVSEIDRISFSTPWSLNAYRYEVTQNEMAHYFVAVPRSSPPRLIAADGWLNRLRQWFIPAPPVHFIVGFSGFWLMIDEAHISTIAVQPEYRRRGVGELLIVKMIEQAIALRASRVTLEVRESNYGAQRLYDKYGLVVTGRRRAYYTDNREDARIMTAEGIQTAAYQEKLARLKASLYQRMAEPVPS